MIFGKKYKAKLPKNWRYKIGQIRNSNGDLQWHYALQRRVPGGKDVGYRVSVSDLADVDIQGMTHRQYERVRQLGYYEVSPVKVQWEDVQLDHTEELGEALYAKDSFDLLQLIVNKVQELEAVVHFDDAEWEYM